MAKDSFSFREAIYSRYAIERIVRDPALHSYISRVPQDTFRRYSNRLPGIKGFRKGTSAYLQRALSLCEHAIRTAVATNTKLDTGDQKILSAVWRSWIESAFDEQEQEILYRNLGKAIISKEEAGVVQEVLEKKEGISKETVETVVRLSPLEDCSPIAPAIERFPSAREREIQQIVDTLPEQFSQLERRFQVDEKRLSDFEMDVKTRLTKIQKRCEEIGKVENECKDLRSATARVAQRLNSVESFYTALTGQIDVLAKSKDSIEIAARESEERLSERLNELRAAIETAQSEVKKRDELLRSDIQNLQSGLSHRKSESSVSNARIAEWDPSDHEALGSLQDLYDRLISQSEVAGMDQRAAREVSAEIVASWVSGLVPHIKGGRAIVLIRALASITSDDLRSVWIRINPGDLAMREALAQVDCLRKVTAATSKVPIVPLIGANRLPAELVEELVIGMKDGIDGRGVRVPTVLASLDAGELGLGVGLSIVRRGPIFDTDMLRWQVAAGTVPFYNCIAVNANLFSIGTATLDGDLFDDLADLLEKTENKGLISTISRYIAALDFVTSLVGIEPFTRQSVIARFINLHNGTADTAGADIAIREFLRPTQGPTASTAYAIGCYYQ